MQNKVIKLTAFNKDVPNTPILIGVDSIIMVKRQKSRKFGNWEQPVEITYIESRAAMVTSFEVIESVEDVWHLINQGI